MTQRRFEMLKSHCWNSSKMLNQFQNNLQYVGHFCTSYQNFSLTVITRCIFLAGSIFLSWNGIQEIWYCLKWGKRKRKLQRKHEILNAICVKGKDFFRFSLCMALTSLQIFIKPMNLRNFGLIVMSILFMLFRRYNIIKRNSWWILLVVHTEVVRSFILCCCKFFPWENCEKGKQCSPQKLYERTSNNF